MALFRKDPNALPRGNWIEDPLQRFDQRLLVEVSMRERDWGAHVRLGSAVHRDPLPPRFTLAWSEQFQAMRSRAHMTVSRSGPSTALKSMGSATAYYEDKVSCLFSVVAPSFPSDRRGEFDRMMASAMQMSGGDYLEELDANESHREAFDQVCEKRDPKANLAWFWDVDDYFQMPNFHDDLIFRGGQLILSNIGLSERAFLGQPFT